MIRQLPVRGGRNPKLALLDPQLATWVLKEAKRYNVGASFVLNNIVSMVSGIPLLHDSYREAARKRNPDKVKDPPLRIVRTGTK